MRSDWGAVVTAAFTRLRFSKTRQAAMVPAGVYDCQNWRLQLTRLFFLFLLTLLAAQCCDCLCVLTPWSAMFFVFLPRPGAPMASSRPPAPRVAVEAHSLIAANLMGRSLPVSLSEGSRRTETSSGLCARGPGREQTSCGLGLGQQESRKKQATTV